MDFFTLLTYSAVSMLRIYIHQMCTFQSHPKRGIFGPAVKSDFVEKAVEKKHVLLQIETYFLTGCTNTDTTIDSG